MAKNYSPRITILQLHFWDCSCIPLCEGVQSLVLRWKISTRQACVCPETTQVWIKMLYYKIDISTFLSLVHLPFLFSTRQKLRLPHCLGLSSPSEIMGKPALQPSSLTSYSSAVTASKYCSVIWVRRRKTRSTQVSQTPTGTSIKLWFISTRTECTRTRGHVFTPGFLFSNRVGEGRPR